MTRVPALIHPIPDYGTGRILVDTHLYLPSYADARKRVTFVVDTGATATVLAFEDWSRIIPSSAWDSLPVNTSAVSISGASYGSHTGAEILFMGADGQPSVSVSSRSVPESRQAPFHAIIAGDGRDDGRGADVLHAVRGGGT